MVDYPPTATITTSRELIERLALDLVDMHNDEGINLEYWPSAREFVSRWHVGDIKAQKRRG